MTAKQKHHWIVEHIWRGLRALLIISAICVWLFQDGFGGTDWLVLALSLMAHMTEQFHGFICNKIQGLFGWAQDFNNFN